MPSHTMARAPARTRAGLAIIAFAATVASAANPAAADPSFDGVRAAVRESWARHPAAEAAGQTLAAAEARALAAARPLHNPDLELAADDEGPEQTITGGLALTLDLSGKRRARADAGQADLALAEAEWALRRSGFAHQWLEAWVGHGIALERSRVGDQRVELVEHFAVLAERQHEVGDISSLERDLALLARDEARAEQASLLADVATAEEALRAVGGTPAIAMGLSRVQDPPPAMPVGSWDVRGIPEGRVAAAASTRATRRIAIAERDRRPDPTISLYGGRKDLGAGAGNDGVVGLAVSIPLFLRNDFRAELAAARADSAAAAAEERRIELELKARAARVVATYESVRTAWSRWSQSPATDVTTRAGMLERLWRAGEISTSDHLVQLNQSLETALAAADLRGRLWRSFFDALYATGQLESWVGFPRRDSEVTP